MRALVLTDEGLQYRSDYPDPAPGPGEVRLRVLYAGICDTDLQLARGYMGFRGVLGHEFVGVPESGELAGSTVVCEINCSCGTCPRCHLGLGRHCPHRTVLGILNHDGAFADYICVPERNLHVLPPSVPPRLGVFVEPLAAAFEILEQVDVEKGVSALVLGDGKLGYLVAQVLRLAGATVLVQGRHSAKLQRFQAVGIPVRFAQDAPDREEFDLVVDCTGAVEGLPEAVRRVRPRGIVVLKTTTANDLRWNPAPLVIDEVTVIGSRCGPFPPAIAALVEKRVEVESLIDRICPLERALEAFSEAARPGAGKVILRIQS